MVSADNTCVGYQAGDIITTGNQNTCIGSGADVNSASVSNSTAIGYNAVRQQVMRFLLVMIV